MRERVASRVATRYTGAARRKARDPASISPGLLIGTPISPCTNGTLHALQMEKQQHRTKGLGPTRHQTSGATGNDQQGLNNSVVATVFDSRNNVHSLPEDNLTLSTVHLIQLCSLFHPDTVLVSTH